MNEAAALPSPRVLLSRRLKQYYGRLRLPPGSRPLPGSSPVIGPEHSGDPPQNHRAGEGLPSSRRHLPNVQRPIRREVLEGSTSKLFTPSMAFAPNGRARLLLSPPEGGLLTTRQASLDAADRLVAPPEGLLTLGFDPTRFQTEPPACYRASWQLPGPDSHRQATTSTNESSIYIMGLHSSWRTCGRS